MAINSTTQSVTDWGRFYIPDPKSRTKVVREEEIGYTTIATSSRETFYLKNASLDSVTLYIDPYKYSSTASLGSAASTDKVFQFNATLQTCVIPSGADPSIRPNQNRSVLANYEYLEGVPYSYSDTELSAFMPAAISYINNTYGFSYTYSGTGTSLEVSYDSDNDREIIARGLAIIVRKSFVDEQKRHGLGVKFRGPTNSIDSVAQMKSYEAATIELEKVLEKKYWEGKVTNVTGVSNLYDENTI